MKRASAILLLLAALAGAGAPAAAEWTDKVDPWVLRTAGTERQTEFLAVLRERADLSGAAALADRRAKGRFVFERLSAVARRSQGPLLAALAERGVEHRSFWVANMVWVRGDLGDVRAVAEHAEVARLYANPRVELSFPQRELTKRSVAAAIGENVVHTGRAL